MKIIMTVIYFGCVHLNKNRKKNKKNKPETRGMSRSKNIHSWDFESLFRGFFCFLVMFCIEQTFNERGKKQQQQKKWYELK